MSRVWRVTHPVSLRDDTYSEVVDDTDYSISIMERIIEVIGSTMVALLSLRFLLGLFGANPANPFAHFIFSVTNPLVRPFVGLFGTIPNLGEARIQYESLIAIVVYGFLTILLARLVAIPRRHPQ